MDYVGKLVLFILFQINLKLFFRYNIKVPTKDLPVDDAVTVEKYNKINLICKKELSKIFKKQLGKKEFGCKCKVFHHAGGCTCHCNDWNLSKEDVKKAGIFLSLLLAAVQRVFHFRLAL